MPRTKAQERAALRILLDQADELARVRAQLRTVEHYIEARDQVLRGQEIEIAQLRARVHELERHQVVLKAEASVPEER